MQEEIQIASTEDSLMQAVLRLEAAADRAAAAADDAVRSSAAAEASANRATAVIEKLIATRQGQ